MGLDVRLADRVWEDNRVVFAQSIVVLLIVWTALAYGFNLEDTISSPALVTVSMYELLMSGVWVDDMVATFRRVIYATVVTIVIGTTVGILMGVSTFWGKALQDYIVVGLALPSLFAVIFSAMWFGFSDLTAVAAGAIGAAPYITLNVFEATKNLDSELAEMTNSFDVGRRRTVRRYIIPSILPEWFSGARYSFAICWKITTLVELIVAEVGVGVMIRRQMDLLSLTGVLTWTILFALLILVIEYGLFQRIERSVFAWRQESTGLIGMA